MSIVLAIETSTEVASAALLCQRGLFRRESAGVHTHSESILPMVQELLREADVSLAQCDAIAFGVGPRFFYRSTHRMRGSAGFGFRRRAASRSHRDAGSDGAGLP